MNLKAFTLTILIQLCNCSVHCKHYHWSTGVAHFSILQRDANVRTYRSHYILCYWFTCANHCFL